MLTLLRLSLTNTSIPARKLMQRNSTSLCSFGIEGLDVITRGGLPRNRLYLIQGDPGAGKTTLALSFLLAGLKAREKVLYITLSETKEELDQIASSHGWSLDGIEILELSTIEKHLQTLSPDTLFHPSEVELNRTAEFLMQRIQASRPSRVVLDSLAELRLMSETPLRYRRQMLALKQFFSGTRVTVLMLDDQTERRDLQVLSIAHGVISMEVILQDFGVERRRLRLSKLRGVNFQGGYHDFVIEEGSFRVFPRLVASDYSVDAPRLKVLTSGIPTLDALLGGGIDLGTSTLIMGPAGTGKSTLSMCLAVAAIEQGLKASIFTFDENLQTLIARGDALQLDFSGRMNSGLSVTRVDPASLTPGQFVHRIREEVLSQGVRVVVIDSLNGYLNAAPSERYLNIHLHELLTFLSQNGVATLLTVAQQGSLGSPQAPVDITYLADTVMLLRFFEFAGEVRKALSVIKKRTGKPERSIREFSIDDDGVRVGEPLAAFHGVLTGVPTFYGKSDQILPERQHLDHAHAG